MESIYFFSIKKNNRRHTTTDKGQTTAVGRGNTYNFKKIWKCSSATAINRPGFCEREETVRGPELSGWQHQPAEPSSLVGWPLDRVAVTFQSDGGRSNSLFSHSAVRRVLITAVDNVNGRRLSGARATTVSPNVISSRSIPPVFSSYALFTTPRSPRPTAIINSIQIITFPFFSFSPRRARLSLSPPPSRPRARPTTTSHRAPPRRTSVPTVLPDARCSTLRRRRRRPSPPRKLLVFRVSYKLTNIYCNIIRILIYSVIRYVFFGF